jgi:hypothetical protein
MSDRIFISFQTDFYILFPLPEVNVAKPYLWVPISVCFVASGLSQPTIIRLSPSKRLRIIVSGNIPIVDRTAAGISLTEEVIAVVSDDMFLFCFTVSK